MHIRVSALIVSLSVKTDRPTKKVACFSVSSRYNFMNIFRIPPSVVYKYLIFFSSTRVFITFLLESEYPILARRQSPKSTRAQPLTYISRTCFTTVRDTFVIWVTHAAGRRCGGVFPGRVKIFQRKQTTTRLRYNLSDPTRNPYCPPNSRRDSSSCLDLGARGCHVTPCHLSSARTHIDRRRLICSSQALASCYNL